MFEYTYTKTPCSLGALTKEISDSAIITALDHISLLGSSVSVYFKAELSTTDENILTDIITNHTGIDLPTDPSTFVLSDGQGNKINQIDNDNAMIVRVKAAKKGWSFWAVPIEITTSTLNGTLYCKDSLDSDIPGIVCKIYNSENQEIISSENLGSCVKTIVDFEPAFDYEVIGGILRTDSSIDSDVRLWIVGAPDIPAIYGGSKEFASGVNLKFLPAKGSFDVDGRVAKYLSYNATTHQSKLRMVLKHPAGYSTNLQIIIHLYRQ